MSRKRLNYQYESLRLQINCYFVLAQEKIIWCKKVLKSKYDNTGSVDVYTVTKVVKTFVLVTDHLNKYICPR